MAPLLKGAFVSFADTFLVPEPNVVIFQFNPETMTHEWSEAEAAEPPRIGKSNPLAVSGLPGESFRFELMLDANETVADGPVVGAAIAEASGVYARLAALELLMFPVASPPGLVGTVAAAVAAVAAGLTGDTERPVPQSQVPTVLFVWGPGRILPVRVTSLTVTEKLYDSLLNPTQATASVGVRVLTPDELEYVTGPLRRIAKASYSYSLGLREVLALANLAGPVESIIGMVPL